MPRRRSSAGPPQPRIRWTENEAETEDDIVFRNGYTWKSACYRGDPQVTLHTNLAGDQLFVKELDFLKNMNLRGQNINDEMEEVYWLPHWRPSEDVERTEQPQVVQDKRLDRWIQGFKLHWKRILAEGGHGVATLWEAEFENGEREPVVIKFDPHDRTRLDREWLWHQRYSGAAHIVQARDLELMARHRQSAESAPPFFDLETFNCSVLEYMSHGTLLDIFRKVSMLSINFPNNALWQLWGCLVEGAAEVAYQNNFSQYHVDGFSINWRTAMDQGEESVRDFLAYLETLEISHDVHFDLEETNILVSDDQNGNIVFKLHDFGDAWSHAMRAAWPRWVDRQYWIMRKPAKSFRYLPEQHSKEWDDIDVHGRQEGARFRGDVFDAPGKCQVAGRYGSWSNVFIIARTMECAITKNEFAHPFSAMAFHGDQAATYAWRLNPDVPPYDGVDRDLIKIIHRCMHDAPMDRPSLTRLLAELAQARREGRLDNNDETRAFWKTVTRPMAELYEEMWRNDGDNDGDNDDDNGDDGGDGGDGSDGDDGDDDSDDGYGNRTTIRAPNQNPPGDHDNRTTPRAPTQPRQPGRGGRTPLPNYRGQVMARGAAKRPAAAGKGEIKTRRRSWFIMNVRNGRRREPLWRNRGRRVGRMSQAGPITMRNLRHRDDNLDREAALERHLAERQSTYPEIHEYSQRQHRRRFRSTRDQMVQMERAFRRAEMLQQQGQQAQGRTSGPMDLDSPV